MSEFMTRVLRRETHSPRSGLSVVAAILVTLAAIYALLEAVLAALGQPTWLVHPLAAAQWIADLPGSYPPALLGAAGVLMALVGLIFLGTGSTAVVEACFPAAGHGTSLPTRAWQLWLMTRS